MPTVPRLGAPALCQTFTVEAAKIWNDLRASLAGGIQRDEETITNDLLLAIHRAHPNDVAIFQFKKAHEKITGADWEWWLTDGRVWLGLLIQAKRLNTRSHKYPSIKHKVGKRRVPQIDLLIDQARMKGVDALYCFYNYSSAGLEHFKWGCESIGPDLLQLGCTVAHAVAVKRLLQSGAGLPMMSKISLPMRCLVCCPVLAAPDHSLPGRANGIARHLAGVLPGDDDSVVLDHPYVRDEPPTYVRRLLAAGEGERGRVIEELRAAIGPVGSLVVTKQRDKA